MVEVITDKLADNFHHFIRVSFLKIKARTQALFSYGRNTEVCFKTFYLLWTFICVFLCRDIIIDTRWVSAGHNVRKIRVKHFT